MNKSEMEQRAKARRSAALQSKTEIDLENRARKREAYMQGGPGPNDPKNLGFPGELKYPRMEVPVGGDSRQWEQTWFEGAAEVSKQKMGPSGVELELKKKLQRAKLSAKFTKMGSRKDSYWNFYATDKDSGKKGLIFRASVDEIFGREGQEVSNDEWSWVASNDYAKFAMEKMRTDGVEKVAYALKGVGLTKAGTAAIIRAEAFDKARKAVLLGRRVSRNLNLVSDKFKIALAQDYKDLQAVLQDLKLVDKSVEQIGHTKAANEKNRFVLYRLADEAILDANTTLQDVLNNVKTAEATFASKLNKKALSDAPMGAGAMPGEAQDMSSGMSSQVENPDRAKQKSAPMPGGGMPYQEGGELYPPADERHAAPMTDQLAAAHGDLPFREWEQLELKNLSTGPHGTQRSFDKAEWAMEEMVAGDVVPTGNEYEHKEAAGGEVSHTDEMQEPSPGLNPDLPEGRWGFETAQEDYLVLPEGGMGGGMDSHMPEEHDEAESADMEEEPKEDESEEKSEEEPSEHEEHEEAEEESEEDEPGEEEEEEEEKTAEASLDRRTRAETRRKFLAAIDKIALDPAAKGYEKNQWEPLMTDPEMKSFYNQLYQGPGTQGKGSAGTRAEVDPAMEADAGKKRDAAFQDLTGGALSAPADEADEADEAVKASFDAVKKTQTAKNETALRQKRAYDLALDFQAKHWIENTKEALHAQAAQFASMDDKHFGIFKAMMTNLKPIKQSSDSAETKIEKIAGRQRQVIKSGSSQAGEDNLEKALEKLPWS